MNNGVTKKAHPMLFVIVASVVSLILFSQMRLSLDSYIVDDSSYVSHAFTIALDFDLDYSNEPLDPVAIGPSGNVPKHPVGPGAFASPFVFLFSLVDRAIGFPVIDDHRQFQYSWSHFGMWAAASAYFLGGVFLYFLSLRRLFAIARFWQVLLFSSAIGMIYYIGYRPTWGHAYEFFTIAVAFYGSAMLFHNEGAGWRMLLYSSIAAFGIVGTLAVRPANINVVALPLLVVLVRDIAREEREKSVYLDLVRGFWLLLFLSVFYFALGIVYQKLYGAFFPSPSDMYGITPGVDGSSSRIPELSDLSSTVNVAQEILYLSPNLLKIVFSSEFGLLYFAPILVTGTVALLGFLAITRVRLSLLVYALAVTLVYLAIPVTIVVLWRTTASAYGYRYLFSLFPVAIFGYYLLVNHLRERGKGRRFLSSGLRYGTIGLSMFAVASQLFFNTGSGLNLSARTNVFGVHHCCSGIGYLDAVAERMVSPKGWYVMYTHRAPSVFVGKALDKTQSITGWGVPEALKEYRGALRYLAESSRKYPNVMLMQLLILALIWGVAVWYGTSIRYRADRTGFYD